MQRPQALAAKGPGVDDAKGAAESAEGWEARFFCCPLSISMRFCRPLILFQGRAWRLPPPMAKYRGIAHRRKNKGDESCRPTLFLREARSPKEERGLALFERPADGVFPTRPHAGGAVVSDRGRARPKDAEGFYRGRPPLGRPPETTAGAFVRGLGQSFFEAAGGPQHRTAVGPAGKGAGV